MRERSICGALVDSIVMPGEAGLPRVTARADERLIVACGCSPVELARLQGAVRGIARLLPIERFADLPIRSGSALRVAELIVLAVRPDAARDAVVVAREIRRTFPRTALVAYCGGVRDTPASIGALAAAGVHQFLFAEVNDRGATLRAILDGASQQCVAEVVLAALRHHVPAALHPMLEAALTRPAIVTDVRALADALGVHRKTLFNRCAQAEFLAPAELLLWARLCLAGYLLETTGHTVESLSLDLGYPSPTALRNTMKRYTGLRPTAVRSGGGLALVIARLGARLQQLPAPTDAPSSTSPSAPLHIL